MKMETIIRSPQRGTVAKLVHKPGVCTLSVGNYYIRLIMKTNRTFAKLVPY